MSQEFDRDSLPPIGSLGETDPKSPSIEELSREAADETRAALDERDIRVSDALASRKITPQYAEFLKGITSSTMGSSVANLEKTRIALALKDNLPQEMFGVKRVAYMASGNDWRFPVALGARDIDMVDMEFGREDSVSTLLGRVQEVDPNAGLTTIDNTPTISFHINLGSGEETVKLNLHSGDAKDYTPETELGGVIEFLGIGEHRNADYPLLFPNIAEHLSPDALVLNFDVRSNARTDGFETKTYTDNVTIYQAKNLEKIRQTSARQK